MTKIQAMKALEAKGLGFTANVIMNGCGKPATKMRTLVKLIEAGVEVRHAPYETCAVVIENKFFWLGALDEGFDAILTTIAVSAA